MPKTFTATDLDLNNHSMENLSWRLVTLCKGVLEENPGALNIYGSTMHAYTLMVILESEMSDFGPQACSCKLIQSRESVVCIIQSRNIRTYVPQCTPTSDVCLSLMSDGFTLFLMRYGIPINSAWFKQDGSGPHINNAPLHFFLTFSSPTEPVSCIIWGRIFMTTKLIELKFLRLFPMDLLKRSGFFFQKYPYTVSELLSNQGLKLFL